jgi:hypothetical protein
MLDIQLYALRSLDGLISIIGSICCVRRPSLIHLSFLSPHSYERHKIQQFRYGDADFFSIQLSVIKIYLLEILLRERGKMMEEYRH